MRGVLFAIVACAVMAVAGPAVAGTPVAAWDGRLNTNGLQTIPAPSQLTASGYHQLDLTTELPTVKNSDDSRWSTKADYLEGDNVWYHPVQVFKFSGGTDDQMDISWEGLAQYEGADGIDPIGKTIYVWNGLEWKVPPDVGYLGNTQTAEAPYLLTNLPNPGLEIYIAVVGGAGPGPHVLYTDYISVTVHPAA